MAQITIEPHNSAQPNGDSAIADEPLGVTQASPERVKVCQLKLASQFSMPIQVGDKEVTGIVDSAADVSIISDKVYQSLKNPPKKTPQVNTTNRWPSAGHARFYCWSCKIENWLKMV